MFYIFFQYDSGMGISKEETVEVPKNSSKPYCTTLFANYNSAKRHMKRRHPDEDQMEEPVELDEEEFN
jgi:hypothetical protein